MYRDEILDHYRHPRNEGTIEDAMTETGENPSCGDETQISVRTEGSTIQEIKHETDGCAISTAASSILSEELKGRDVEEVMGLDREWMTDLMGIDVSPMRMKCAMLGLKTVQQALENHSPDTETE